MWGYRTWRMLIALELFLSGSALAQSTPTDSAQNASRPDTTLIAVQGEVTSSRTGEVRRFTAGEQLHSGDRVTLQVAVEQPVYVYVVSREPGGQPVVLFPASGELHLDAGKLHRIPADGSAIELDEKTGEEDIFVVASRQPLPRRTDAFIGQIIDARPATLQNPLPLSTTPVPPPQTPEPVRPPPMPIRTLDRDPKKVCAQNLSAVCARANRSGIAVAKLSFSHATPRSRGPLPTNSR